MKQIILASLLIFSTNTFAAQGDGPGNSDTTNKIASMKDTGMAIHSVDQVIKLVKKPGLEVKIVVESTGGSTDLSPTKKVYFAIYSENEMVDLESVYELGYFFEVTSATRISGGVYQMEASIPDDNAGGGPIKKTFIINAIDAVNKVQKAPCEEFSKCSVASEIQVKMK